MRLKYVLGLACGLTLATGAAAQQTPVQTKQVQPAQASPYPPPLYRMNDINQSLKLNQDQIQRLNTVTDRIQAQYSAQYGKLNTLSDAERFARTQELNRQYYSDWHKSAGDIFTDEQRLRYQQLNHQYGGFNTIYDPDVQKRLNLTPAQMKSLDENAAWSNQQLQTINTAGATDPTRAAQMYNAYWKERQQRFNTYLTPAQQQTWREMTGQPYTFQPAFNPPPK